MKLEYRLQEKARRVFKMQITQHQGGADRKESSVGGSTQDTRGDPASRRMGLGSLQGAMPSLEQPFGFLGDDCGDNG